MKKILIILVWIAVIVVLLHVALFVFINLKGRDIIIAKLQKDFGSEARLESISLSFPFAIEIKNFRSSDLSFRKAKASLGLSNPFRRFLISNLSLEDPVINVTLDRKGVRAEPIFSKSWRQRSKKTPEEIKEKPSLSGQKTNFESRSVEPRQIENESKPARKFSLVIKNIYIKGGRIQLTNRLKREPIVTIINNIDAYLKNISYPDLEKFILDISGALKTEEGVSRKNIALKGWVDYSNKNMEVELGLDKIDYSAFEDYYPPNWKLEGLGVKEALLSLESNFVSENNDLTIKNTLFLDSIEYLELAEDQEGSSRAKTVKTILAFIAMGDNKPSFNFVVKTKMDTPKIDFASIKESFNTTFNFGLGGILQGAANVMQENVKELIKDNKELGADDAVERMKETGEELIDALKDIFIPKLIEMGEEGALEAKEQDHPNPVVAP
ncbi:MAG: DUF748 domain-containing protein [Candidatus Omnitrophica bacterium]|nr:DUF748 domain-containing protein [Candidatus Omnitrophota bacterium]